MSVPFYWRFLSLKSYLKTIVQDFLLAREQRREQEAAISAYNKQTAFEAQKILDVQKEYLKNNASQIFVAEKTQLGIEMQFLSGVYLFFQEKFSAPTDPITRSFLLLISWLSAKGWMFEKARAEVAELKHLYDTKDKLFMIIYNAGYNAAKNGKPNELCMVIEGLNKADLEMGTHLLQSDINRRSNA